MAGSKRSKRRTLLMVGTRKGAFFFHGDPARRTWRLDGPHLLGCIVHHLVLDPRDSQTMLMATRTGHLGPVIMRSTDRGRTWTEASLPPAFAKAPEGHTGRAVDHTFWLSPGLPSQPGVWWAGTSPHGLFRSEDGGVTWSGIEGFNRNLVARIGTIGQDTPDGAVTHSILVDPRDPKHLYVGLSGGGSFESLDGGASWRALNSGVAATFLPDKDPEIGQDPHIMALHPLKPDRLYQQNHCGIYRLDRPGDVWTRIGMNMPKTVGDIGFPLVLHPRDPDTLWVIPMDGTTVWPRTSPGGKPAVYRSRNAGKSWERQAAGLPTRDAWLTIKRQAFDDDGGEPLGLYFGTTSGEIWMSTDEGKRWRCLARHLPEIYSVQAAALG
ncbi:MAG: glycosyl hydrolase [Candidatus Rokubacteria bacterium]|nr:glycosyl hydrolase [Candidatus Rokubacteria bacterium]